MVSPLLYMHDYTSYEYPIAVALRFRLRTRQLIKNGTPDLASKRFRVHPLKQPPLGDRLCKSTTPPRVVTTLDRIVFVLNEVPLHLYYEV